MRDKTIRSGFTLVELLVVIGIIAVLVGILLPALNKARRAAATVQCQSNMKQIAIGMLQYIQNNKGKFPPSGAPTIAGVYPYGWWWANELVRGKYIDAKSTNVYSHAGSNVGEKRFNNNSVFRCPEGVSQDEMAGNSNTISPTDAGNNGYSILNDGSSPGAQDEGLGIPSWYMLNSRVVNTGGTGVSLPGGKMAPPFAWFNSSTVATDLQNPAWQRYMALVRKPSELIMLVEASSPNFYDQTGEGTPPMYFRRLGARHGTKTADGRNAYTNFAFFDGHVGLYPTAPYQTPQWHNADYYRETIFFVTQQAGH
jgi:prepilin-type N-terminal cleavage/methylation domain-containing protein/prepilin-type processing-associated H-X9-DG protein